ncbi:hypothetical protein [Sutterella sp.]|uniref:hypothetical protein n=1 Tax=Sutterella sp. TaxID=1981025 RepID=UPI0026E0C764|nr:hypothetical protein [Sutterella sp.]MDO5531891.1 hypothetical protein [Sutterella sp.]
MLLDENEFLNAVNNLTNPFKLLADPLRTYLPTSLAMVPHPVGDLVSSVGITESSLVVAAWFFQFLSARAADSRENWTGLLDKFFSEEIDGFERAMPRLSVEEQVLARAALATFQGGKWERLRGALSRRRAADDAGDADPWNIMNRLCRDSRRSYIKNVRDKAVTFRIGVLLNFARLAHGFPGRLGIPEEVQNELYARALELGGAMRLGDMELLRAIPPGRRLGTESNFSFLYGASPGLALLGRRFELLCWQSPKAAMELMSRFGDEVLNERREIVKRRNGDDGEFDPKSLPPVKGAAARSFLELMKLKERFVGRRNAAEEDWTPAALSHALRHCHGAAAWLGREYCGLEPPAFIPLDAPKEEPFRIPQEKAGEALLSGWYPWGRLIEDARSDVPTPFEEFLDALGLPASAAAEAPAPAERLGELLEAHSPELVAFALAFASMECLDRNVPEEFFRGHVARRAISVADAPAAGETEETGDGAWGGFSAEARLLNETRRMVREDLPPLAEAWFSLAEEHGDAADAVKLADLEWKALMRSFEARYARGADEGLRRLLNLEFGFALAFLAKENCVDDDGIERFGGVWRPVRIDRAFLLEARALSLEMVVAMKDEILGSMRELVQDDPEPAAVAAALGLQ